MVKILFLATLLVAYTSAHSMMQCANYDVAQGRCLVPIRNSGQSKISQSYRWNQNPSQACQNPYASPLSSWYGSGSSCPSWAGCPDPMGTIAAGSTFNVMWYARNHAVANQGPGNVEVYLSPRITTNADPSGDVFKQNKVCEGSYMNCPGGNGDLAPCYLQCTLPANTPAGTYTLWWYWDWTSNDGNIYTTCSDFTVTSSSGSATTGPATTGPATTGRATTGPATTGPVTTGPATTGTTTGSGSSGGNAGTTTGELLVAVRSPATVPRSGSFNVTVGYYAHGSRDIVVDLLDSNNYTWYGKGFATVNAGKGGAVVTVNIQNSPAVGNDYILHLWSVGTGMDNGEYVYDNQIVPVRVASSLTYTQQC